METFVEICYTVSDDICLTKFSYSHRHVPWAVATIVFAQSVFMVPTAKEILFSRKNYIRFKSNKSRYVLKSYIYSMYDQLLTFLWYRLLNTSSCLIHPPLFKF